MRNFQLAGDIGGTKTTLAIIDPEAGPRVFLDKATFTSRDFHSLGEIVEQFLKVKNRKVTRASFGIAGPIVDGHVQATNLPWFIEEDKLSEQLRIPVKLINDLTATAHAVPFLSGGDKLALNSGLDVKNGTLAVVAPGTGLGEAYLSWGGNRYRAYPSEGGHSDFAPTNPLQLRLLEFLSRRFEHVSYERVCSGSGLPNLYSFLKDEGAITEPAWLQDQIAKGLDPAPVITKAALDGTADIAVATLDLFAAILGAEAGNLVLRVLANGGVYLGGGIPPRIAPILKKGPFLKSFLNKGRFSNHLTSVPVYIILNPEAALIGAACYGLEMDPDHD
jgi:glucokinase